jgi:hypothetical protein
MIVRSRPGVLCVALVACAVPSEELDGAPDDRRVAVYRVAEGDSLSMIAEELRVPGGWRALAELNHLTDPHRIRAGSYLQLPFGVDEGLARGLESFHVPEPASEGLVPCRSAHPLARIELADPMIVPRHHAECVDAGHGDWLCALTYRDGSTDFVRLRGDRILAAADPDDALEQARAGALTRAGRVTGVDTANAYESGLVIAVSLGGSEPVAYRTLAAMELDAGDEGFYTGVGWQGDGRLLPDRYLPADPAAWIGRDVVVETRTDLHGDEAALARYLWLQRPDAAR